MPAFPNDEGRRLNVTEAPAFAYQVAYDHVHTLGLELGVGVLFDFPGLGGKAHQVRPPRHSCHLSEYVGGRFQFERGGRVIAFQLVAAVFRRPVVGHRRAGNEDVALRCALHHGREHFLGGHHVDAPHRGRGKCLGGSGNQLDIRAAARRGVRDRKTHQAGALIG